MTSWDPAQYLRFGAERLRPALDLIQRVPLAAPRRIYDLGCGTGTVTALLKQRRPQASITGIDSSETMLERARTEIAAVNWVTADLTQWQPDEFPDLLFSNAALHWLDDHATLFRRFLEWLRPGGVLAVQMPNNFKAPTHTAIDEVLRSGPFPALTDIEHQAQRPADPLSYYNLLTPLTSHLDLWETTYYHILDGEDPLVEWTKGSILRPLLRALADDERETFLAGYRERLREAYPPGEDGRTVLPFKRLFLIAVHDPSAARMNAPLPAE